jgi:hypothetical protein
MKERIGRFQDLGETLFKAISFVGTDRLWPLAREGPEQRPAILPLLALGPGWGSGDSAQAECNICIGKCEICHHYRSRWYVSSAALRCLGGLKTPALDGPTTPIGTDA